MNAEHSLLLVLVVVGACGALVLYEVLVRSVFPEGAPVSVGESAEKESSRWSELTGWRLWAVTMLTGLSAWIERVAPFGRANVEACRERLGRAGVRMAPETWRALRLVAVVSGVLVAAFAVTTLGEQLPFTVRVGGIGLGAALGWFLPSVALSQREATRRREIEARLPDAMELLGIAVAAGSPIEQCFREVAASLQGPLAEEFSLVDQEVNLLGHAREKALENLAERCRSREVSSFVAQLTQAVSQGSSIAEGLVLQAALAREATQASALERIRAMPTKLDIVLSLCFLPPTVILVVVPTVVNLLHFLNDTLA